jgi:hypothetical protein
MVHTRIARAARQKQTSATAQPIIKITSLCISSYPFPIPSLPVLDTFPQSSNFKG